MASGRTHLLLFVGLESLLLSAVIVSHGDNGEDKVDEVERSKEDDKNEEDHLRLAVRLDRLQSHPTHRTAAVKVSKILPEPHGPRVGADLRFLSQTSAYTARPRIRDYCRCLFTPQLAPTTEGWPGWVDLSWLVTNRDGLPVCKLR